jgi:YaiO family outer membrane protein
MTLSNSSQRPLDCIRHQPRRSTTLLRCALTALLVTARLASAQDAPAAPRVTVEVSAGQHQLSTGGDPWREQELSLRYRHSTRTGGGVTAERLERFGLEDQRVAASLSTGLGRRVTLGGDGEMSPTHRVIARHGASGFAHLSLPAGWGVEVRGSTRAFADATVLGGALTVERYWGPFRAAYSATPVRLDDRRPATTHGARLTRFFGERSALTLMLAAGEGVEALSASGPLVAPLRSVGLWGDLPLARRLALTYAADVTRHGTLFTRRDLSLGARLVAH